MTIKPLFDRVVAKKEQPLEKTASGILLGESKQKPNYATVSAIGPDVKTVKTGDKIIYKEYSATEVEIDQTKYLILKEEDILATL